jgi:hypothetical protein
MNNSLKVILTAIGIAVLASPVMAQPSHSRAAAVSNAHGSALHVRTHSTAPAQESQTRIDDCIRTPFPQCSGGQ